MLKKIFPLSQIKVGEIVTIENVAGPEDLAQRLLEMGMIPGTIIEVVRFAPMGNPIDIKLRGYHLSLRREEAETVMVSICPICQN